MLPTSWKINLINQDCVWKVNCLHKSPSYIFHIWPHCITCYIAISFHMYKCTPILFLCISKIKCIYWFPATLYCVYVDHTKAFDSVHRFSPHFLVKVVVQVKFIDVFKSLHKNMLSYVQVMVCFINWDHPNVCLLMYVNDLMACSDSIGRLQKLINALSGVKPKQWGLETVVFLVEKKMVWWKYRNYTTTNYKYLGLVFSSRLKWTKATQTLAAKIKKHYYKENHI